MNGVKRMKQGRSFSTEVNDSDADGMNEDKVKFLFTSRTSYPQQ